MKRLVNRIAFVTGSSRGIGQQIAMGLAREGADVILHGRTIANTDGTREMLKSTGVKIDAVEGDLGNAADVQRIIDTILKKHGRVDVLYNNAAVQAKWKKIYDHTPEDWQTLFAVNLWAMNALCNSFVPGMKQRGWGRVINMTSGIKDQPEFAPYSVSKAAVDKYTEISWDIKGTGVLANYVDPGWLKTDMGGPNAMGEVEDVLPGALVPALYENDGPNGTFIAAQDYRGKTI